MSTQDKNPLDIGKLTASVEELLQLCETLMEENERLRKQNRQLLRDKTALNEKNQLSQSKISSMITRLKTLEVEL
ncbi:MAG TPA: TIGR02449 family protein [Chromatiales bacterium]|nr:TIGR02449 family protein [Chromatiales bacterium]